MSLSDPVEELGKASAELLGIIRDKGPLTSSELKTVFGGRTSLYYHTVVLRERGLIRVRRGPNGKRLWEAVQ